MKTMLTTTLALAVCALAAVACAGGSATPVPGANAAQAPWPQNAPGSRPAAVSACAPGVAPTAAPGPTPALAAGLHVPPGYAIDVIARVGGARQLAILPDGDLLVGTSGSTVYLVPNADATGAAGAPVAFASVDDAPDQGVAFAPSICRVFIATQNGIYSTPYKTGDRVAEKLTKIASVRTGSIAPNSDGDVHHSTSVAFANGVLYASVGSSCNACVEVDPTRASIQQMNATGAGMKTRATRIRNAIALAVNPVSGHLWAGGAGQDDLPDYHPYEFFDDVTSHAGVADYGWPECEEDHVAYTAGANCKSTVEPLIVLPAYSTIIGAAFYPASQTGPYTFVPAYLGGIFLAAHGSWHTPGGCNVPPQVAFFSMQGDVPHRKAAWRNAYWQWTSFVSGFQPGCTGTSRIGRPTGLAVGPKGSLFVGDDFTGEVYRVRRT